MPPNYAPADWAEEMRAQGSAAACQALCDFDPERGVPLGAFVRQRVLAGARTRYRQEWAYALRVAALDADPERAEADPEITLCCALARLPEPDRRLIEQLFWERSTEAEIGQALGISHQAVSKRKRAILRELRAWLEVSRKF